MRKPSGRLSRFLVASVILAGALTYGWTQNAPDLVTPIRIIFPESQTIEARQGVHHVWGSDGALIGWAGVGTADGYGGPMLLVVGIDTSGLVAGVQVVEQRETPVFWRMVRSPDYIREITGAPYEAIDYDYESVVAVTGATLSADAIVESVRTSVASRMPSETK